MQRPIRAVLFTALWLSVIPYPALAAELIVVQQPGCGYCARFDREIAPAYPKTAEGRQAPLRRVELQAPWPDDLHNVAPSRVTPTFILIDQGREVGRLTGYPGDEYFWFLLSELLQKIERPASPAAL